MIPSVMVPDDLARSSSALLELPPHATTSPVLTAEALSPAVETWRPPEPAAAPPEEPSPTGERRRRSTRATGVSPFSRFARSARARKGRRRVFALISATLKIGLVLFVTYGLVFNFSVVRGSSMSPGIHDGDRILVDHLSFVFRDVQRGDIVVLEYPLDPTLDYIKRVIGLPGDDVRIDGGSVYVNGRRLDEPYISEGDPRTHMLQKVAPDSFFVLGDNRPHSSDSREFGQVPRENLVGRVNVRVWPPSRAGIID
jgi:signal peptidase I